MTCTACLPLPDGDVTSWVATPLVATPLKLATRAAAAVMSDC